MAEYKTEYVSGDNYEILRQGSISTGGSYCILNGSPSTLILTVPKENGEESVREVLEGSYEDHQWGSYYLKKTKRWCIPVLDRDIDKLETCVKKL